MQEKMNAPLVWIDLEMTGLDTAKDEIIEIAVVITNNQLDILAKGPDLAIQCDDSILDNMNEWCRYHHGASGLTKRVKESPYSVRDAEVQVIEFLEKMGLEAGRSPLCGNSIGTDRAFLDAKMPALAAFFHYRNVDVSSIKELVKRWYQGFYRFQKDNQHTALSDILESIAELRFYRDIFFKEKSQIDWNSAAEKGHVKEGFKKGT